MTLAMCCAGEGIEGEEEERGGALKALDLLFPESKRPFFTFWVEGNVCVVATRDGASEGNGSHCRHNLLS
jgi:hypothetical protein